MGQQTQTSGRSTLMNPSSVPPVEVDYIVCGLCQRDFPLANIVSFIQHKKFDCDDFRDYQGLRSRVLSCKSCPRKFNTPWRLLQHAQSVHSLNIYSEQAELVTLTGLHPGCPTSTGHDIDPRENHFLPASNFSDGFHDRASLDLHNYSLTVPQEGKHGVLLHKRPVENCTAESFLEGIIEYQGIEKTQAKPVISVREIAPTISQEVLETSKENINSKQNTPAIEYNDLTSTTSSSGEVQRDTNSNHQDTSSTGHLDGLNRPRESERIREVVSENEKCCDNQDCGITLMPGTHEEPKKCCIAVVPKKRKRHMQTKHMSTAGRLSRRRSSSTGEMHKPCTKTVYIDIDPSVDSPDSSPTKQLYRTLPPPPRDATLEDSPDTMVSIQHIASEVEVNSSEKPGVLVKKNPTSVEVTNAPDVEHVKIEDQAKAPSNGLATPASRQGMYIIEPGTTFSIPVSGSVALASVFSDLINPQPLGRVQENSGGLSIDKITQGNNHLAQVGNGELEPGGVKVTQGVQGGSTSVMPSQATDVSGVLIGVGSGSVPEGSGGVVQHGGLETRERPRGLTTKTLNFKEYRERRRRYPTSKPFKCDKCSQAFNQRIHLKKHQSKHTGIKPFQCEQCDYSTVEKSHLKVHIRVHTGEKPFKCTYCEYATAQNSTLKIHLKRHLQGTAGVRCLQCRKEFSEPEGLTTHSRTEHQPHRQVIMPDSQAPSSPLLPQELQAGRPAQSQTASGREEGDMGANNQAGQQTSTSTGNNEVDQIFKSDSTDG